jgi:hypothetical protein
MLQLHVQDGCFLKIVQDNANIEYVNNLPSLHRHYFCK